MKKSLLLKIVIAVAVVGLLFISFSVRDAMIDLRMSDYTDNEIEREFINNRESFTAAADYLKAFGGDGVIIPMESSRYIKEKNFPDYVPEEMCPTFNKVFTKYFSKIKYFSEPFRLAVYSANEQIAVVYTEGEPPQDGKKKEIGDGWYIYQQENTEESMSE